MGIPILNVYYLLCYAWDRLEARNTVDSSSLTGNRIEDLLGNVLAEGTAHLIRRGLDRGYVPFEEEGPRLRGKFQLSNTLKRSLLVRGHASCLVDDLSLDVPHNRAIKAAMRNLVALPLLDGKIRVRLRSHLARLETVADEPLAAPLFRRIQLHRNIAGYGFLIQVCQLLAESLLPDPVTGQQRFHPFTANEQTMGALFERFVRNFLRREQDLYDVSAPKVPWALQPLFGSDSTLLPEMRTDIVLTTERRRIIIETKYYAKPYQEHHNTRKLISSHLYQLLTYLTHLKETNGPAPEGILLYAGPGWPPPLDYQIGPHRLRIRTVNLDQDWPAIHRDLLALSLEGAGAASEGPVRGLPSRLSPPPTAIPTSAHSSERGST